jgi:hypothetical protein
LITDQTNVDMCFYLKCLVAIKKMKTISKITVFLDLIPCSLVHPDVSKEAAASVF